MQGKWLLATQLPGSHLLVEVLFQYVTNGIQITTGRTINVIMGFSLPYSSKSVQSLLVIFPFKNLASLRLSRTRS